MGSSFILEESSIGKSNPPPPLFIKSSLEFYKQGKKFPESSKSPGIKILIKVDTSYKEKAAFTTNAMGMNIIHSLVFTEFSLYVHEVKMRIVMMVIRKIDMGRGVFLSKICYKYLLF